MNEALEFIAGLGAAVWPLAVSPQQPKAQVIGFLGAVSAATLAVVHLPAFRRGLKEAGYVEGRNVSVEYLWADGFDHRLPALAAELVPAKVDVIVAAGGTITAVAAKAATMTIPTIILAGDDPVRVGLVASINRPGANITGIAQLVVASEGKRLELLRELAPEAKRVAFLTNLNRPNSPEQREAMQEAAGQWGLGWWCSKPAMTTTFLERSPPRDATPARWSSERTHISLPGSSLAHAYHQVGVYTGKVLKGAHPAELPVRQANS